MMSQREMALIRLIASEAPLTIKRQVLHAVLGCLAFVGSCTGLMFPAFPLAEPTTHRPVDLGSPPIEFPILVVEGDTPRVLQLEDPHKIPALPPGATYLVPEGKEAAFQQYFNDRFDRARDVGWVLKVRRTGPDRQRIELFLMGDGFWGGVYDATPTTVTPLYRKLADPGFAFVVMGLAMLLNLAIWGIGALIYARVRRWRKSSVPVTP
jgi:hypothetical protein